MKECHKGCWSRKLPLYQTAVYDAGCWLTSRQDLLLVSYEFDKIRKLHDQSGQGYSRSKTWCLGISSTGETSAQQISKLIPFFLLFVVSEIKTAITTALSMLWCHLLGVQVAQLQGKATRHSPGRCSKFRESLEAIIQMIIPVPWFVSI